MSFFLEISYEFFDSGSNKEFMASNAKKSSEQTKYHTLAKTGFLLGICHGWFLLC